ncbi:CRISPR-associated protein [Sporomusa sp. KB1]|jgi:CRISPR-associated protein Csh2|uniref:CRISPR-associated protein n=1 Tax=Sporomusa sp. KB1 TaxID=943346 RepID=UPI0011AA06AE|nr:type I CRISPR-associated protein Cas7 [Sporomusa sp. KB1]TWH47928.1 CRISPR-associated protein Csh2 [Sporomusa sp. KB1]
MVVKSNRDFLFLFEATMTSPNGDPDQENKPRMDYETNTLLVSDARRKRDVRDFIKTKGYQIFVDTLAENKVSMETMFEAVISNFLKNKDKMDKLLNKYTILRELAKAAELVIDDLVQYIMGRKEILKKSKKKSELIKFNNELLTAIIKETLIDIRWFGSAMAVEGLSRTYTGPIQLTWGYSLHPVELVQSSTITSIMNDDNSTFGKKYKVYYALTTHYGTVSKHNAEKTGMTESDLEVFRKALVQGLMSNQTDSKQGQSPLLYLEIVYKPEFDGYLGDLRRFIKVEYEENRPIRNMSDLQVNFEPLNQVLGKIADKYEKVLLWKHPALAEGAINNLPKQVEALDLLEFIPRQM